MASWMWSCRTTSAERSMYHFRQRISSLEQQGEGNCGEGSSSRDQQTKVVPALRNHQTEMVLHPGSISVFLDEEPFQSKGS